MTKCIMEREVVMNQDTYRFRNSVKLLLDHTFKFLDYSDSFAKEMIYVKITQ